MARRRRAPAALAANAKSVMPREHGTIRGENREDKLKRSSFATPKKMPPHECYASRSQDKDDNASQTDEHNDNAAMPAVTQHEICCCWRRNVKDYYAQCARGEGTLSAAIAPREGQRRRGVRVGSIVGVLSTLQEAPHARRRHHHASSVYVADAVQKPRRNAAAAAELELLRYRTSMGANVRAAQPNRQRVAAAVAIMA